MRNTWSIEFNRDAERFEKIKRTRGRRGFAISMLHHTGAGPRSHETGHGRNIQGVGASTRSSAGAHNVNGVWSWRKFDRRCRLEHRIDHRRDFPNRLALYTKRNQERGNLSVGGIAREDFVQRAARLLRCQIRAGDKRRDQSRPFHVQAVRRR